MLYDDSPKPSEARQTAARSALFERRVHFQELFTAYGHWASPTLALAETLMQGESSLTMGERELIGSYVAMLKGCPFTSGMHSTVAEGMGVEHGLVEELVRNCSSASVSEPLRALIKYVRKLVLEPSKITREDTDVLIHEGWSKRAVFDAVAVTSFVTMMSTLEVGMMLKEGWDVAGAREHTAAVGREISRKGYRALRDLCGVLPMVCSSDSVSSVAVGGGTIAPPVIAMPPPMPLLRGRIPPEGLAVGERVVLHGIGGTHEGKVARVLEFVPHVNKWRVELANAIVLRVDMTNCVRLLPPDAVAPEAAAAATASTMEQKATRFAASALSIRSTPVFGPRDAVAPLPAVMDCIRAACASISEVNQQPWTYVVVRNPAIRRELRTRMEEAEKENFKSRMNEQWRADIQEATQGLPEEMQWERPSIESAPYCVAVFRHVWRPGPSKRRLPIYFPEQCTAMSCGVFLAALAHTGISASAFRIRYGDKELKGQKSANARIAQLLHRPEQEKLLMIVSCGTLVGASHSQVELPIKPFGKVCVLIDSFAADQDDAKDREGENWVGSSLAAGRPRA